MEDGVKYPHCTVEFIDGRTEAHLGIFLCDRMGRLVIDPKRSKSEERAIGLVLVPSGIYAIHVDSISSVGKSGGPKGKELMRTKYRSANIMYTLSSCSTQLWPCWYGDDNLCGNVSDAYKCGGSGYTYRSCVSDRIGLP